MPSRAIEGRKMLLADRACTSPIQSFNLFTVCSLQWPKDSDVAGPELVGGVRGNTAEDVILKTKLHNFERLMRPKAVTNKDSWFLVC